MTEPLILTHERVDDVPLLLGLMARLQLPDLLDRHLGQHGNHQGLSNGWLAAVWLAFILSEGDHYKSHVQEWAHRHTFTLQQFLGQPLRPTEFTDDRLGLLLHRLGEKNAWEALEAALWQQTVAVYELPLSDVRLDSTTSYGYHTPTEGGLMQVGFSKDHHPGTPQLKLMAAALEGCGHLVAADVCPGQTADASLYLPLITRLRHFLGREGLLYTGDCKMAAHAIRAAIVAHGDYYVMPLPRSGADGEWLERWVEAVVAGEQEVALLWDEERLLGYGYEFVREQHATVNGEEVRWRERVLVTRSLTRARQQAQALEKQLQQAQQALAALMRPPTSPRRIYTQEARVEAAVEQILTRFQVKGLLRVTWERHEAVDPHSVAPRRPGPGRPRKRKVTVRYRVTAVQRDEEAITHLQSRLGWRALVTNVPAVRLGLTAAVLHYREAWRLERGFQLLKGKPLGIRPLCVRQDDQITGLTRLLTLGLRLLTLVEIQVRRGVEQSGTPIVGLDPGQPKRATERPTGVRLLKGLARAEITLTRVQWREETRWHLTPLSPLLLQVLAHLGLSASLYTRLIQNSS